MKTYISTPIHSLTGIQAPYFYFEAEKDKAEITARSLSGLGRFKEWNFYITTKSV